MTITEICLSLATFAFIILVIFLVKALISLIKTLGTVEKFTRKVEEKVEPGGNEIVRLAKNLNGISETVDQQLNSLNPLFETVSTIGTKLDSAAKTLGNEKFAHKVESEKTSAGIERAELLIELAAFGILLWQQINKRR